MSPASYQENFFNLHLHDSLSSAREVIPVVLSYVKPTSVIDIGCGIGTWLKIWQENGITDIAGVDGPYVNQENLLIDKALFSCFNLEEGYKANRKYDMVASLEVAEHIRPEFASNFIDSLCSLGDVVLFSAAIPGQEGTFHYNEQYPGYWASLFLKNNFVAIDNIREKIWVNEKIAWWYRQNLMFFVSKQALMKYDKLETAYKQNNDFPLPLVHPALLKRKDEQLSYFKKSLHNPFRTIIYFAKKLIGK